MSRSFLKRLYSDEEMWKRRDVKDDFNPDGKDSPLATVYKLEQKLENVDRADLTYSTRYGNNWYVRGRLNEDHNFSPPFVRLKVQMQTDGTIYRLNVLFVHDDDIAKLGDMGVDVIQFNLHKTFSTPHGGGGPGAGPVGVTSKLEPYLPIPRLKKSSQGWIWSSDFKKSIGRVKGFFGNFGVFVRAYTYMNALGGNGLTKVSEMAVLNANYVKARLKAHYHLPYDGRPCMHEVVFNDKKQNAFGIKTLDIAKRLIDYNFHPPTIYFPLIVQGALMIEPPETEPKEEIDRFCEAMISIAREAQENPQIILESPQASPVKRVDEVRAVRKLKLTAS